MSSATPDITFTYFPVQSVGEKVRLALALARIPFEDQRVAFADWPKMKPTTKYGQLPVMTVDGKEVHQSEAMLRYVGRLHPSIYPKEHYLAIDEAIGLINDLYRVWTPVKNISKRPTLLGYPADFAATEQGQATIQRVRQWFAATELPVFLGHFEALLEGHSFLVGDEPTIADCMLVPALRIYSLGEVEHVPTTCLDGHPAIKAYIDRFLALPAIKEFYDKKQRV